MRVGGRLQRLNRCAMVTAAAAAFKQLECHFNINRPSNQSEKQLCISRLYSSGSAEEAHPQLSPDLISIMEHKLSAIENRHAHLQAIVNQVIFIFSLSFFTSSTCSTKFLCYQRQPDASPDEYSKANKELKKLQHTVDVVAELRRKNQVIHSFIHSLCCRS